MKPKRVDCFLVLALSALNAQAAPADVAQNLLPDLELLEFLGEWQTPKGQWVDPLQFEEPPLDDRVGKSGPSEGKYDE